MINAMKNDTLNYVVTSNRALIRFPHFEHLH